MICDPDIPWPDGQDCSSFEDGTVERVLVLSTGHVPERMLLVGATLDVVQRFVDHDYGWIVFHADDEEDREQRDAAGSSPCFRGGA